MGAIETRLLFALAALVSAMLHASLFVGLDYGAPAPVQQLRIEIRDVDDPAQPKPTRPSASNPDDGSRGREQNELLTAGESYRRQLRENATARYAARRPGKVSWRQRLRNKEARHEAAMAEKEAKLAILGAMKSGLSDSFSAANTNIFRCGDTRHRRVVADGERDVNRYVGVFPAGLFPVRYVAQMRELSGVTGRGRWSFALPQGSLPIVLDAPKGVLLAAGRDDRRCVVDVDVTPKTFFPLRFLQVPLRIVDQNDRVHATVVDVRLFDDGTFRLSRVAGDALPFQEGALYDHETVGRNLRRHYLGARLLRDMAGVMFGDGL